MSALHAARSAPPPPAGHFSVAQVRSSIGAKPKTRATLRALGLGRIGKRNTLPDRPELRGMLRKVAHLVLVREASDDATHADGATQSGAANNTAAANNTDTDGANPNAAANPPA